VRSVIAPEAAIITEAMIGTVAAKSEQSSIIK